ncbi:SRPBCC family protein [Mesorhizobium sp. ANAO-SY3R2]|uniref:SRPBCC family protein n=1 Tax=Mesorhizobium sp. ANAO-SY3R2 TaxID=3166644 RepID=UPI00366F8696
MTPSPVAHSTFVIERELPASPRHAYRFWSEAALKQRWNDCHPDWKVVEDSFDFRVGGIEAKRWRLADGSEQTFRALYFDIVPEQRIIYGFDMSFRGQKVSASLATIELIPAGKQTRMKFTEQLAFLGEPDAMRQRIAGTEDGFDRLVEIVTRDAVSLH